MKSKTITFIFSLLFLLQTSSFSQSKATDNGLRLTPKELQAMAFTQFISAKSDHVVSSCIVTVEIGKELKEFSIQDGKLPEGLKSRFTQAMPGEMITVDTRIAVVDGKRRKLPALVYYIVESK